MYTETISALLDFIDRSPTCFHVVDNLKKMLPNAVPLREEEVWTLEPGKSYYVTRNHSSLIAFRLPKGKLKGLRLAAAHSDSPVFKVKPRPEMGQEGLYVKLNVEKYGGMLIAPWLDRPLSVAGRLVLRSEGGMTAKLVNVDRDLCLIPHVAIHLDRTANDGAAMNLQTDLLPLLGAGEDMGAFLPLVAEAAGVRAEDVLDYDLYVYNRMKGTIWGAEREFFSSRSLDDLECVWPLMQGYLAAEPSEEYGALLGVFDTEEVGSGSRQGAGSTFLSDVTERIFDALGLGLQERQAALAQTTLVSADNAHAVHPNHPEKSDPTNRTALNGGIVIKYNAAQRYTTDGYSAAWFKLVCEAAGVPWQSYVNRSDIAGGSTLGHIALQRVGVSAVDIGLPQLAMHSPYETAGVKDPACLLEAMRVYFSAGGF